MLDIPPSAVAKPKRLPPSSRAAIGIIAALVLVVGAVVMNRSQSATDPVTDVSADASTPASFDSITPIGPTGRWNLIFHDEFTGTELDRTKWIPCISAGWTADDKRPCPSWGGELQRYRPDNVTVSGGAVHLRAQHESNGSYTSGSISTAEDAFGFDQPGYHPFGYKYGYFEARIRTPDQEGMWPAVWSMPVGGGGNGEMDLYELLSTAGDPKRISMALHGRDPADLIGQTHPVIPDIAQNYHVFGAEWTSDSLTWRVDGRVVMTVTGKIPDRAEFPMANLAIGGQVGLPDPNQAWPLTMDIDYMRVFQRG